MSRSGTQNASLNSRAARSEEEEEEKTSTGHPAFVTVLGSCP